MHVALLKAEKVIVNPDFFLLLFVSLIVLGCVHHLTQNSVPVMVLGDVLVGNLATT